MECKIEEITLLSIEEYYRYRSLIPYLNKYWWLRSPGYDSLHAAYVCSSGAVDDYGFYVYCTDIGVRPALRISVSDSSEFLRGCSIELFDKTWTVLDITGDQIYVLADNIIGGHIFDTKSNVWETSELKAWLQEWVKEQCKECENEIEEER